MAQNPRFNNSGMFTDASEGYSEITPDSTSEVLATQGNVINSIKTFWNNLRTKLAYAISRPEYSKQVGGNYVPIFVNTNGVVQECQPTTIQANIESNGIITIPIKDIPNNSIYTGTTVCINVLNNNASVSSSNLQIQHKDSAFSVKYPSGVTVQAKDISNGDLLLATFCKNSKSSSNNFWILLNKINTVVSTGQTTSNGSGNGGHPGLMTAEDKAKLETIAWSANNYSLPEATDKALGGIKLGYATNETDRNYKLETDNNGNGYVNVPWTVYSLPTASSSEKGGVKLGADRLATLETPKSTSNADRYYPIQTDKDDKLVVNVPWTDTDTHNTAELRAGNNNSISNEATNNGDTYLKIVDGGSKTSSLNISGTGGTTVKSDDSGNITISSPIVNTYYLLSSTNNSNRAAYLIKGPGASNANTNYYLAGDGTWVKGRLVPTNGATGQILKWGQNGPYWADAE